MPSPSTSRRRDSGELANFHGSRDREREHRHHHQHSRNPDSRNTHSKDLIADVSHHHERNGDREAQRHREESERMRGWQYEEERPSRAPGDGLDRRRNSHERPREARELFPEERRGSALSPPRARGLEREDGWHPSTSGERARDGNHRDAGWDHGKRYRDRSPADHIHRRHDSSHHRRDDRDYPREHGEPSDHGRTSPRRSAHRESQWSPPSRHSGRGRSPELARRLSRSKDGLDVRSERWGEDAVGREGRHRPAADIAGRDASPPRKLRRVPGAVPVVGLDDKVVKDNPDAKREEEKAPSEHKAEQEPETRVKEEEPMARPPSPDLPPPPAPEAPPPESPPPPDRLAPLPSAAAARRKQIRARLRPLRERVFVGCSETSAYEKVDESRGGLLGKGTFGEVSRARHILTQQEVALKKIKIQATESHNGMPITALREIKLLKKLSHPNICPVIDMVYEPPSLTAGTNGTVYMVLPYMEHDLNGLIERLDMEGKPFSPAQIKLYMKQLFEGTLYLHQNKILHRDIKAANILISNDGSLRIADFGLARPYHDPGDAVGRPAWRMDDKGQSGWRGGDASYTGMVVTRWYRPPELLAGDRRYGPAVDMWGLGCLLAEMIVRRPIFKGSSEINQLELITELCGSPTESNYPGWASLPGVKNVDNSGQTKAPNPEQGRHDFGNRNRRVREHFMNLVRSELADLIDKLLVLDPRKRLTAEGALAHKWFDVEPLPADPASLPQYPDSKEANKSQQPMPPNSKPPLQRAPPHMPAGPGQQPMPGNPNMPMMGYNNAPMRPAGPGVGVGMSMAAAPGMSMNPNMNMNMNPNTGMGMNMSMGPMGMGAQAGSIRMGQNSAISMQGMPMQQHPNMGGGGMQQQGMMGGGPGWNNGWSGGGGGGGGGHGGPPNGGGHYGGGPGGRHGNPYGNHGQRMGGHYGPRH